MTSTHKAPSADGCAGGDDGVRAVEFSHLETPTATAVDKAAASPSTTPFLA